MLLVFHGAGTNGLIGQNIVQIAPVFRIKHLICGCQSAFPNRTYVHLPDRNDAGQKIRILIRFRLVKHSLISLPCCTGFVCINTRNNHKPVRHLFIYFRQTVYILAYRIFVVRRAGPDNYNKFIRFSGENLSDLPVSLLLDFPNFRRKRVFFLQIRRERKLCIYSHSHSPVTLLSVIRYPKPLYQNMTIFYSVYKITVLYINALYICIQFIVFFVFCVKQDDKPGYVVGQSSV